MFSYSFKDKTEDKRKSYFDVPEVKPISLLAGIGLFGAITVVGMGVGAAIGTYVFFGCVTLAGLIAIAESNKYIKRFVIKSNKTIDVTIFVASIYAIATLGVTMAASLTVAGLGYTLMYAPYIRNRAKKQQSKKE